MMKYRTTSPCRSPASEQSSHHATNQSTWTASTVVMVSNAATTDGMIVIRQAGMRRRGGLGQYRLMLQRVEEASPGIPPCRLPTRDDGTGRLVEPSADLGVETETGQPALHVATLSLVEANLIFGFLSCLVGNDCRIDGCHQVAFGRARTGYGNICTDENSHD